MIGDGNGWSAAPNGATAWGRFGAAGLCLVALEPEPRVLLQLRSMFTHAGGTWALPGGARDSHETAEDAAVREAVEETCLDATRITILDSVVTAGPFPADPHRPDLAGGWTYTTVLATCRRELALTPNQESEDLRWTPLNEVEQYPLLPAFKAAWPRVRARVDRALRR